HDAGAGDDFDHRCPMSGTRCMRAAASQHLVRGLDANAVRRSAIGGPPDAAVEPDLAMSATCVFPIDDDVAAFAAADDVTLPGNHRRQRHTAVAIRVVDFDFEGSSGDGRARRFESASLVRRGDNPVLRPAAFETYLIGMLARARLAAAELRQ